MSADQYLTGIVCFCAHCMGGEADGLIAEGRYPIPTGPGIPDPPTFPTGPGIPAPPAIPAPPEIPAPPTVPPPSTAPETPAEGSSGYTGPRFHTLLGGDDWNGTAVGAPALVPYSFATRSLSYYATATSQGLAGFDPARSEPLDASQRASIRQALTLWEEVSGLFFVEVPDQPELDFNGIRFSMEDLSWLNTPGVVGLAMPNSLTPNSLRYGFNIQFSRTHYADDPLRIGSDPFVTAMHEIGHAVGLKHPFHGSPNLSAAEDNTGNTVMSYTDGGNFTRLGPYDIDAVRHIYGTQAAEDAAPVRWAHGPGGSLVSIGDNADNRIVGLFIRDIVHGQGGNDTVEMLGGDDDVAPGAGNDTVFGGAGTDALVTGALRRHAVVAGNADQGTVALPDGTDTFYGVETLRFVDGALHFHAHGPAGQAQRLYGAALGRAPDAIGLGGWTFALQSGATSLADAANGFIGSAEFGLRYGALGDAEFISLLYANVLARAPESGAVGHWLNQMHGGAGRAGVLLGFSESTEYKLKTAAAFNGGLWVADPEAVDVLRAYVAVLDRQPDAAGLAHWTAAREAGLSQAEMVSHFFASPEFQARFGGLSNRDFVDQLYRAALDRPADAVGLAEWSRALDTGAAGRAGVAQGFAQSDELALKLAPLVADGFLFV